TRWPPAGRLAPPPSRPTTRGPRTPRPPGWGPSWGRGRRPSTRAARRSSATSWARWSWGCRRSHGLTEAPGTKPPGAERTRPGSSARPGLPPLPHTDDVRRPGPRTRGEGRRGLPPVVQKHERRPALTLHRCAFHHKPLRESRPGSLAGGNALPVLRGRSDRAAP